jgi:hypothetical protein
MDFGWDSPVGPGILLAGLGILLWGAQGTWKGKGE